MIKAVIFDMDGLMFDTERLWEDAFIVVGKKFGYDISADFHRKTIGTTYGAIEKIFRLEFGDDFPFEDFIAECRKYMDEIIRKEGLKIKKGLINLLNYLKDNNYLIAIASSSKLSRINWYLECSNIDKNLFNVIVSGEDVLRGKPNPDVFVKACDLLGVDYDKAIVLEDSNNGLKAANAAGCISALIADLDIIEKDVLNKVDFKFDSLDDVILLLEEGA